MAITPSSFPKAELGDYRLEALIGRGGMSEVYRARHGSTGKQVALKVLDPQLARQSGFRERFLRESRVASKLDHPNIVRVHEAGEDEGLLYIAMPLVLGTDLRFVLEAEGRLGLTRTCPILTQVSSALDAAHAGGLVHRDVKPANILLARTEEGEVAFLSDFGLTKHMTSDSRVTASGQLVGSVQYMAPEQIEGKRVDPRTDVYALTCVLYECLTGSSPYPRDSDLAVMWAHVRDDPPSVIDLCPDLPASVEEVVRRGMAKSPDDRYPSAGALAHALVHGGPDATIVRRRSWLGTRRPSVRTRRAQARRFAKKLIFAKGTLVIAVSALWGGALTVVPTPEGSPVQGEVALADPSEGGITVGGNGDLAPDVNEVVAAIGRGGAVRGSGAPAMEGSFLSLGRRRTTTDAGYRGAGSPETSPVFSGSEGAKGGDGAAEGTDDGDSAPSDPGESVPPAEDDPSPAPPPDSVEGWGEKGVGTKLTVRFEATFGEVIDGWIQMTDADGEEFSGTVDCGEVSGRRARIGGVLDDGRRYVLKVTDDPDGFTIGDETSACENSNMAYPSGDPFGGNADIIIRDS